MPGYRHKGKKQIIAGSSMGKRKSDEKTARVHVFKRRFTSTQFMRTA